MIVATILQLKEEAGQKMTAEAGAGAPAVKPLDAPAAAPPAPGAAGDKKKAAPVSSDNRSIEVSSTFTAPAKEVFECFTVPQKCMAFTQSRCQVKSRVNLSMEFWNTRANCY